MKKLIAVAVLSAFAAPAFADSGNVTISGFVRGDYQHAGTGNSNYLANDAVSQNRIDGRAELEFAGTEDLGNGLSAVWGLKTRTSTDGTGKDEFGSVTNVGQVGGKQAYVGLKGSFGQVRLGSDLNNYGDGKHSGFVVNGAEYFGKMIKLAYGQSTTVSTDSNVVRYDLPAMGNFTSSVRVNLGENKSATNSADAGYIVRADYDTESWDIGGAYQHVTDKAATSARSANQYNLTGAYRFGNGLELAAEYEHKKVADDARATKEFMVYVNYAVDKIEVGGEIGRARLASDDSKEKTYGLYANYNLSKRTKAFAEYVSSKNDAANAKRSSMFTLGLKHAF